MKKANITVNEFKDIQENILHPDAFVAAYNVIFCTNIKYISQVQINEDTAVKINEIFNKWLVFVCNTCITTELISAGVLPKGTNQQIIHRNFVVNDINDQSEIAHKMRTKLLKYELCDFYNIFWLALAEWQDNRANLIKHAYKRKKETKRPSINAVFVIPKRQEQTMRRAFKSMFGVSVAEVMASAIFLLLKEQMNSSDISTKRELASEIKRIEQFIDTYIKYKNAAKKSRKIQKNDSD